LDNYRNNVVEDKSYFDAKDGELRLNYKNLPECADQPIFCLRALQIIFDKGEV
jgi:hypothetical protein